jgi:hypothetical protein
MHRPQTATKATLTHYMDRCLHPIPCMPFHKLMASHLPKRPLFLKAMAIHTRILPLYNNKDTLRPQPQHKPLSILPRRCSQATTTRNSESRVHNSLHKPLRHQLASRSVKKFAARNARVGPTIEKCSPSAGVIILRLPRGIASVTKGRSHRTSSSSGHNHCRKPWVHPHRPYLFELWIRVHSNARPYSRAGNVIFAMPTSKVRSTITSPAKSSTGTFPPANGTRFEKGVKLDRHRRLPSRQWHRCRKRLIGFLPRLPKLHSMIGDLFEVPEG